jgi:hypothetical protein
MNGSGQHRSDVVGCATLRAFIEFLVRTEAGRQELEKLYKEVRHLVISGREYHMDDIGLVQAFEKMDRLVLPKFSFSRFYPSGKFIYVMDDFDNELAARLAWKWKMMEERKQLRKEGLDESEAVRKVLDLNTKESVKYYYTSEDYKKMGQLDLVQKDTSATEVCFWSNTYMEACFGGKSIK